MSDEISGKKVGRIGSTSRTKAVEGTEGVSDVDQVGRIKATHAVGAVKGVGAAGGATSGGRVVTHAERARLLQIVDDEAKKMFSGSPKKRDLIVQAVTQAIDSGLIVEEPEEQEK